MKTIRTYLLIILLAFTGLFLYQSFLIKGSFQQAQSLSRTFDAHLDTLQSLTTQYQHIQKNYELLYQQLLLSQHQAHDLNFDLSQTATEQQQQVTQIRDSLRQILVDYDSQVTSPSGQTSGQ